MAREQSEELGAPYYATTGGDPKYYGRCRVFRGECRFSSRPNCRGQASGQNAFRRGSIPEGEEVMTTCICMNCRYSEWYRQKNGRLSEDGSGKCLKIQRKTTATPILEHENRLKELENEIYDSEVEIETHRDRIKWRRIEADFLRTQIAEAKGVWAKVFDADQFLKGNVT